MREAVICNPLRTPVGRYGGVFRDIDVTTLGATVIKALLEQTQIAPGVIEDVIFGQCYPSGEAPAVGRVAALQAGMPVETPGLQIDRRCGSGLQAICYAAMQIQTNVADVILAGGAESMSTVEFYSSAPRWGPNNGGIELHDRLARSRVTAGSTLHPVPGGMIETAENVRREYKIPREEQDALALRSHQHAVAAQDEGRFEAEIVPVSVPQRRGEPILISTDEHPRRDTSLETLAKLRPVYSADDPESTVTAGNASGQNDAAAVCIVTTPEKAEALGLKAMGKLRSWAVAGVPPKLMGMGPVPAVKKVFDRLGMDFGDIDRIELNEAFAAQVLGVTREWDLSERDWDRLNVNGSGISIGHPVGATGVRIMATLLHEMHRSDSEIGLETMCIGGGQGLAAVIERVN
jgi:acetyl-CoA C-acetyltransferase